MSLWIVTDEGTVTEGTVCVIVEAEDVDAAAERGINDLQDDYDATHHDGHIFESVYVAPFDGRVAYHRRVAAERAELQCCAGGPHAEYIGCAGHYATCDERPVGTGQPRNRAEWEAMHPGEPWPWGDDDPGRFGNAPADLSPPPAGLADPPDHDDPLGSDEPF